MKQEITVDTLKSNPMTWLEVIRHYWPDMSEGEAEYILWNETCHPFDTGMTLKQLYEKYQSGEAIATK